MGTKACVIVHCLWNEYDWVPKHVLLCTAYGMNMTGYQSMCYCALADRWLFFDVVTMN